jgi:hypothetical protein
VSDLTAARPTLWHVSDDPDIELFRPHRAPTALIDDELVWAIDEEHIPAYWFPRDCPRATFWVGPTTSDADIAWLNGTRRVHVIEWDWWERFRAAHLWMYLMPATSFAVHNAEAGYYVSREPVAPLARVELDDMLRLHAEAGIELRVRNELWPLWDRVVVSTLEFSGIRLRNARPPENSSTSYALLPR